MDDSEIVKLFMDRSEKAISEAAEKYGKYCYKIAFNILSNKEDCNECVNDTFMRAWNSIPPNNPERLQTFLGKITRNLSLNKLEKKRAEKRGGGNIEAVFDELSECIPGDKGLSDITDSMVIRDLLNEFLEALPKETRKIFVRRYWYMSPVKDIAKEYGLTESKVTVTLFRTREKLKSLLEKEDVSL